jgi:hypothetical protein
MNADMYQNRLVNLKRLVQAKVPFTMSTDNARSAGTARGRCHR